MNKEVEGLMFKQDHL